MVPLAEFLELDETSARAASPYVWSVDRKQQLSRLLVELDGAVQRGPPRLLDPCCGRWPADGPGRGRRPGSRRGSGVRQEVVGKIANGLMALAGGEGGPRLVDRRRSCASADRGPEIARGRSRSSNLPQKIRRCGDDYLAPWIDSEDCTACDECIQAQPEMFAYNDRRRRSSRIHGRSLPRPGQGGREAARRR